MSVKFTAFLHFIALPRVKNTVVLNLQILRWKYYKDTYVLNSYHAPAYIQFCRSLHCALPKIDFIASVVILLIFSLILINVYTETYICW